MAILYFAKLTMPFLLQVYPYILPLKIYYGKKSIMSPHNSCFIFGNPFFVFGRNSVFPSKTRRCPHASLGATVHSQYGAVGPIIKSRWGQ